MSYYDSLVAEWATLDQTKTVAENLAILNAATIAGPNKDVPASSVIGYLALNGLLTKWKLFLVSADPTTEAAIAASEMLTLVSTPAITVFGTSDPTTYGAIQAFLGALVMASQITQDQVDVLLGMAGTTLPWWKANNYTSAFNEHDLIAAGILTLQDGVDMGVLGAIE